MGEVTLALKVYKARLNRLLEVWDAEFEKEGSEWHGVNAVMLVNGRQDEERVAKTDCLQ